MGNGLSGYRFSLTVTTDCTVLNILVRAASCAGCFHYILYNSFAPGMRLCFYCVTTDAFSARFAVSLSKNAPCFFYRMIVPSACTLEKQSLSRRNICLLDFCQCIISSNCRGNIRFSICRVSIIFLCICLNVTRARNFVNLSLYVLNLICNGVGVCVLLSCNSSNSLGNRNIGNGQAVNILTTNKEFNYSR